MENEVMYEILEDLGFISTSDNAHIAYFKSYKGFRLFIGKITKKI